MVRTGATFADAAAEFLRYVADERDCKPSTLRDYRSIIDAHLLPAFGKERVEDVTAEMIEEWRGRLARAWRAARRTSCSSSCTACFGARRVSGGLSRNPVAGIENCRQRSSGDI